MSRVIKSLILFPLLFSLAACSSKPIFTVEILKTATASPLPADPTQTASPTTAFATSSFTPTVPAIPINFSPVLYGKKFDANTFFLLLGGVQEGTWVVPDVAANQLLTIQTSQYDVYTFTKGKFQVQGSAPQFSPTSKIYSLQTDATLDEAGMVGVLQGWTVLQGDVQELSSDNEIYRQEVLDWLRTQGIRAPEIGTLHIYRVDIESDGVDEIFLSAAHLDESQHTTKAGDYSVVLMRKVAGNNAVTRPIVADIYDSQEAEITYPRTYSLATFIDLNQDGVLEVVVDVQRWEGVGARVYQINGQDILEVLKVE